MSIKRNVTLALVALLSASCLLFADLDGLSGVAPAHGDSGEGFLDGAAHVDSNPDGSDRFDAEDGVTDAGADAQPLTATIRCGSNSYCSAPSQVCCAGCIRENDGGCANDLSTSFTNCIDPADSMKCRNPNTGQGSLPCSDPSACAVSGHPADVCCGHRGGNSTGYIDDIQCKTRAECLATAPGSSQDPSRINYELLCDPNVANPCGGVNDLPDASCTNVNGFDDFDIFACH